MMTKLYIEHRKLLKWQTNSNDHPYERDVSGFEGSKVWIVMIMTLLKNPYVNAAPKMIYVFVHGV